MDNTSIDFTGLPAKTKNTSRWKTILLATGIAAVLFATIVPIDYISIKHPDSPLVTVAAIALVLGMAAIVFWASKTLWDKLQNQRSIMERFARQNGWQFEGRKEVDTQELIPPGWGFPGTSAEQLYCVRGTAYGIAFNLYALIGLASTLNGKQTIGYRTVLRTTTPLDSRLTPDSIQIIQDGGWNYAVMNSNAMSSNEIQTFFQLLAKP